MLTMFIVLYVYAGISMVMTILEIEGIAELLNVLLPRNQHIPIKMKGNPIAIIAGVIVWPAMVPVVVISKLIAKRPNTNIKGGKSCSM